MDSTADFNSEGLRQFNFLKNNKLNMIPIRTDYHDHPPYVTVYGKFKNSSSQALNIMIHVEHEDSTLVGPLIQE
jgi:hypothetical protein